MTFLFKIDGNPIPQGSKTGYVRGGRAVLVEANKKLPEWRKAIIEACQLEMKTQGITEPIDQPLKLVVIFMMHKPAKPKWDTFPASKPDLDKLVRSVGDALTIAGLIKDDSLIVELLASKVYGQPGCLIALSGVGGN